MAKKHNTKQLKFWLKNFQAEASSLEKRLVEHKRVIKQSKLALKKG